MAQVQWRVGRLSRQGLALWLFIVTAEFGACGG